MAQRIISNNLHHDQNPFETIPLTNFPTITSTLQNHRNPPPSPPDTGDFFEFFRGEFSNHSDEKITSHAEDIIFCGKLLPIKQQLIHPMQQTENPHRRIQKNHHLVCRRSRSQSRANSNSMRSLDCNKLKRSSSMRSENGGSVKKSSPSRWHVLLFGLVNVPPPDMHIRDLKNRQFRLNASKTQPVASSESVTTPSFDHRKCSWRMLDFLSCKSASTAVVTTQFRYMAKA